MKGTVEYFSDFAGKQLIPVLIFFIYGAMGHNVTLENVLLTSIMLSKAYSRLLQVTELIEHR